MCGHDLSPPVDRGALRRHGAGQRYGILTRCRRHVSKQIAVEPPRKGANERARALKTQSATLRLPEIQVAAPPRGKGREWAGETEQLRKAWIVIAEGRLGPAEQEIAGAMTVRFQPNHQRLARKRVEVHPAAHVDQKRLQ